MDLIRRMFFVGAVLFSVTAMSQSNNHLIDGVVSVVGKNVILKSDIEKGIMQYKSQGIAISDNIECTVLEELMVEKLLVHQAIVDSVEITADEVNSSVDQRIQMLISRIGSVKKLEEFYNKSQDELKDEMYDILKDQLMAQRMQQQIIADADVTPEEVRTFFESIPKDKLPQFETEVVLSHVLKKPVFSDETKQETIDKLNVVRADIENGSSFKMKAILYSEDPGSSGKGGAYYGVRKGQFVKPFEEVAFNLQEGEVSEPFLTEFGYHIVQLIKRKGEELDLRHILIRPVIKTADLEETESLLDSIRSKVVNEKITFSEAAKEFSDDETTRFNDGVMINPKTQEGHFELSDLPREIYYKVDAMKVGDISDLIYVKKENGDIEYSIVKLLERIPPHVADFSKDYQKIKQMALAQKRNKLSQDWIKQHISDAYIKISDDYKGCEFKNNWITE